MKLTRKVLFEKCSGFSNYNSVYEEIPDRLWEKAYEEMRNCKAEFIEFSPPESYAKDKCIASCNYIAKKILSPILGNNVNYIINDKITYEEYSFTPVIKVEFYHMCEFEIPMTIAFALDYREFKYFIQNIWNNRSRIKIRKRLF